MHWTAPESHSAAVKNEMWRLRLQEPKSKLHLPLWPLCTPDTHTHGRIHTNMHTQVFSHHSYFSPVLYRAVPSFLPFTPSQTPPHFLHSLQSDGLLQLSGSSFFHLQIKWFRCRNLTKHLACLQPAFKTRNLTSQDSGMLLCSRSHQLLYTERLWLIEIMAKTRAGRYGLWIILWCF